jgi:BirA family biotin operon repressor/biotin-[acetyl-CoA-carboxylase] ligase
MYIEYHASLPSTNDRVKELLRQQQTLPCLVVTQMQSGGRGRGNKRWWSGSGALLMSLGIELSDTALTRDDLPQLSLRVAKAVKEVLRQHCGEYQMTIHPPNDVYVDGKKICGILLESPTPRSAVIGIGLNVNNRLADIPPEFQQELANRSITSMIELFGKETDLAAVTAEIAKSVLKSIA